MGWGFAIGFMIIYFLDRTGNNADVILIAAALFAIAGGLGSVARNIYELARKK